MSTLGICGLTLLLIALVLRDLMQSNKNILLFFYTFNFIGAVLLAVYAFTSTNWIFIILEGVWAIYCLVNTVIAFFPSIPKAFTNTCYKQNSPFTKLINND